MIFISQHTQALMKEKKASGCMYNEGDVTHIISLEGEEDEAAEEQQGAGAQSDRQGGVRLAGDPSRRLADSSLARKRVAPHGNGIQFGYTPQATEAHEGGSGGLHGVAPLEEEAGSSHSCHGCSAGRHFLKKIRHKWSEKQKQFQIEIGDGVVE